MAVTAPQTETVFVPTGRSGRHNTTIPALLFVLPSIVMLALLLVLPMGQAFLRTLQSDAGWGFDNYSRAFRHDDLARVALKHTFIFAALSVVGQYLIGFAVALLLNEKLPFKAIIRAIVLVPFIVPTVLSAIAFWWLFDPQFSIISWSLKKMGWITANIDFLGDPWNARWSVIFANIWRGVPFVAITLLAGLQTVSPSLYEAATIDGATTWQRFRHITYPLLTPIIAVVMTFSVLFTFTDFQLIWVMTRGGPVNATHLMATFSYQRAMMSGYLGEGSAIATAMIPFLLAAIMVSWFGLQRRKWQRGGDND
jgi:multiple sugar transport system permease protein